jgi:hypothetical protein
MFETEDDTIKTNEYVIFEKRTIWLCIYSAFLVLFFIFIVIPVFVA